MGLFWALSFTLICSLSVKMGGTNYVDETQTYIVHVHNEMKPSVFSEVEEWYSSTLQSLTSNNPLLDSQNPTTSTQRDQFLYVYKNVFHGFAARLTKNQAQILKGRPEILGVFPDGVRQLQTTRSPQFLELTTTSTPNNPLTLSDYGSNVIIGVFDSGIWPERRSFSDEGLGPIPSHWKGKCTKGERFNKKNCNKKLIGARYFTAGYDASNQASNATVEIKSARDSDGHGTHTASTAAGNFVTNASFLGFAKGDAMGIAPKARIAVYKVCWAHGSGCLDTDILAAFDKAVEDGVDVISLSVAGIGLAAKPYHVDSIAIGSFGAMERGIFVSASAGNSGPKEMTVDNVAPWITTVGAGSLDRNFPADLVLGDGRVITGASLYKGKILPKNKHFPLEYIGSCQPNNLDPKHIRGKIVACNIDDIDNVKMGLLVKEAGGVGVVIFGVPPPYREGLIAEAHLLPGLSITQSAGYSLKKYFISTENPTATIVFRGTQIGVNPAPVVAYFSSRGPNLESIYVLKPDLIAPGLNILAAWTGDASPTPFAEDKRRTEFNIISGTSMSCPHVSGLAALLKGVHPDWSPAMIRSALMTTAYVHGHNNGNPLVKEYGLASAWDIGAGHVDPIKAVDPGLVYDLTVDDYLNFLCASNYSPQIIKFVTRRLVDCRGKPRKPWDLNYPSISIAFDVSAGSSNLEFVVKRTVTHVSEGALKYTVKIFNPAGVSVNVYPTTMEFKKKGEKQSYMVRISARNFTVPRGNSLGESGMLTWTSTDGKHQVTSPIAVAWQKPWYLMAVVLLFRFFLDLDGWETPSDPNFCSSVLVFFLFCFLKTPLILPFVAFFKMPLDFKSFKCVEKNFKNVLIQFCEGTPLQN